MTERNSSTDTLAQSPNTADARRAQLTAADPLEPNLNLQCRDAKIKFTCL